MGAVCQAPAQARGVALGEVACRVSSWRRIITRSPAPRNDLPGTVEPATRRRGGRPRGRARIRDCGVTAGHDLVGHRHRRRRPGRPRPRGRDDELPTGLELDDRPEQHVLAQLDVVGPGRQRRRAAAAEVVDEVVAVRRHAELAQPAADRRRVGVDVDGADEVPPAGGTCAVGGVARRGARRGVTFQHRDPAHPPRTGRPTSAQQQLVEAPRGHVAARRPTSPRR